MTFAKEAWPFVLPFVLLAFGALALRRPLPALIAGMLALLVLLFFRIPSRAPVSPETTVLAPANGRITAVERVVDPGFAPGEFHHVVTFLSVFNVHVQRAPVAGEVVDTVYRPGRKIAAFRPEAGDVNESALTVIRTGAGEIFAVKQIAGLLARRVVNHVATGDRIARGQLTGLIKFGSRVDLYIPASYRLLVEKGQTVREGATPVATPEP